MTLPSQLATVILVTLVCGVIIGNPAALYIVIAILKFIRPLNLITHMTLIPLNVPINLQEFFAKIFPLVCFDIIPTDKLYEFIFKSSNFEDGPLSDLYD